MGSAFSQVRYELQTPRVGLVFYRRRARKRQPTGEGHLPRLLAEDKTINFIGNVAKDVTYKW